MKIKIRLAILELDKAYLNRIVSVFQSKYADKLEVYSFADKTAAMEAVKTYRIGVLLAGEDFEIDTDELPSGCGFAYLVDARDVNALRGETAICKFQKAELIYKQILGIFSDKTSMVTGCHSGENGGATVVGFFSASGGSGCSTAAASFAVCLARKGKKVIYLNLEILGSSDIFFRGEGQGTFEDVIYSVKSKKSNLSMKLESTVRQDDSGVFFFSGTPTALDMKELKIEETKQIIKELKISCGYDCVVIDMNFFLEKGKMELLSECDEIVMVSDGSRAANEKGSRLLFALNILEQQRGLGIQMRMGILYNRFSSKTSAKLEGCVLREIGGIKRYEGYETRELVKELSKLSVFEEI